MQQLETWRPRAASRRIWPAVWFAAFVFIVAAAFRDDGPAVPAVQTPGPADPQARAILTAFYHATGGDNYWKTSTGWLSDRPLDQWHGVQINDAGKVIGLRLSNNQLTGPIPAELGQLITLEVLWLSHNQLIGPIPAELGQLQNLKDLSLGGNVLTGPIPTELGQLQNLKDLSLWGNRLTAIPAELGQLQNLENLSLGGNA
ncbi:MAG: hypothetical protein F4Z14_00490, partial [Gammaproteobacteria bacterium]|nr:hypothetical protein [Gammaproteobacteria bacterium]